MEHISLEKEEDMIKLEQFFQAKKELNYTAIKDIRIHFKLEEVTKQLKMEHLDILRIFFSMKKKKVIINQ